MVKLATNKNFQSNISQINCFILSLLLLNVHLILEKYLKRDDEKQL